MECREPPDRRGTLLVSNLEDYSLGTDISKLEESRSLDMASVYRDVVRGERVFDSTSACGGLELRIQNACDKRRKSRLPSSGVALPAKIHTVRYFDGTGNQRWSIFGIMKCWRKWGKMWKSRFRRTFSERRFRTSPPASRGSGFIPPKPSTPLAKKAKVNVSSRHSKNQMSEISAFWDTNDFGAMIDRFHFRDTLA